MKITDFIKKVTLAEQKKKQVSIAQISEILCIINKFTDGNFYEMIRKLEK